VKTRFVSVVCVAVCLLVLVGFAASAVAADCGGCGGRAAKTTVTGTISVTKDSDGTLTAVKLTAGDAAYSVVLCKNGQKLAALDGQTVEATGVVKEKDGVKWMVVTAFKAAEQN